MRAEQVTVRARRSRGLELLPVELEGCAPAQFTGRDAVVVDDIADEGRTLEAVCARVREGAPRSLRTMVLVSKLSRRQVPLALDHVGFEVARGWVVGYGMDLDGAYRELDFLGVLEGTEELRMSSGLDQQDGHVVVTAERVRAFDQRARGFLDVVLPPEVADLRGRQRVV